MSEPVLTVDGDPADWLGRQPYGDPCPCGESIKAHRPSREWLAVDTLPWITDQHGSAMVPVNESRPLRAGDAVTLVVERFDRHGDGHDEPFAQATVAEVLPVVSAWHAEDQDDHVCLQLGCSPASSTTLTVHRGGEWEHIDIPTPRLGGWAIRLTDVERSEQ